jgi:hypothetical protein
VRPFAGPIEEYIPATANAWSQLARVDLVRGVVERVDHTEQVAILSGRSPAQVCEHAVGRGCLSHCQR